MASGPSSTRLADLVTALGERSRELENGTLDLDGLDKAVEEARELHEHLVVLRHKAREEKVRGARAPMPQPPPPVNEPAPIRLDVTSPIGDPRQITLIDAIEHEKQVKKEKRAAARAERSHAPAPPVAARPVKDLLRSIPISEKFWFIAELFGKDATAYERTMRAIDAAGSLEAARAIVRADVLDRAAKPPADDVLTAFEERIQRRFQ